MAQDQLTNRYVIPAYELYGVHMVLFDGNH